MSTTAVKDLNVLALFVSDLAGSEAFYREQLGFEKVQDMSPGILMRAGEVTLYLECCGSVGEGGSRSMIGFCPSFATDSVRRSFEALKAAGVPMIAGYREYGPDFALFRISDPDGNLIEFAGAP